MLLIHRVIHRTSIKKFTYIFILISLITNLTSCDSLSFSNLLNSQKPISISTISERYASKHATKNKPIYITGKVIKFAPLLKNNAYQIQDNTGKIWVVTTAKLPTVGQEIHIKGSIKYQSLSELNQNLDELYLVELERLDNS